MPERVFMAGGGKDGEQGSSLNLINMLLSMMLSDKAGIKIGEGGQDLGELERFAAAITSAETVRAAEAAKTGAAAEPAPDSGAA
ncbi:MAG: hypothetical protein WCP06_08500 [Verrucomicrobiota bacterium]